MTNVLAHYVCYKCGAWYRDEESLTCEKCVKEAFMMKCTIAEHEKAIEQITRWIETDREILTRRLQKQESDLLIYKTELERAIRKGLTRFERGKI